MSAPQPQPEPRVPDAGAILQRLDAALLRVFQAGERADPAQRLAATLEAGRIAVLGARTSVWLREAGELRCAAVAPTLPLPGTRVAPELLHELAGSRARAEADGGGHPIRRAFGGGRGPLLLAPIRSGSCVTGLLGCERGGQGRPFDPAEAAIAAGLADRLALLLAGDRGLGPETARLHEAQRLQALGRLTTGVAHDFNNALTAILGGVQLVADGLAEDSDLQATSARTLDAIGFAADLARQLLDFGRGDVEVRAQVRLDDSIRRIQQLLRTLLGDARRLCLDLRSAPAAVCAAPTRLSQVVLNLVANARDALPQGGQVTISTSSNGAEVLLRVADDGVGIPPEIVSRIFEPLFTTKPLGQGCGLGLATVHHVIDELGGSIAVDTAPGRGTAFEIRLPRSG
jgi:signal transduction histidine kinase